MGVCCELVQEKFNLIANTLELRFPCSNPSIDMSPSQVSYGGCIVNDLYTLL